MSTENILRHINEKQSTKPIDKRIDNLCVLSQCNVINQSQSGKLNASPNHKQDSGGVNEAIIIIVVYIKL